MGPGVLQKQVMKVRLGYWFGSLIKDEKEIHRGGVLKNE